MIGLTPSHPGAHLREIVLPALGSRRPRSLACSGYLKRRSVMCLPNGSRSRQAWHCGSASCAVNDPELWIDLQRAYDLNAAERDLADEIAKIPSLTAA
jgi:hypothetical protein